MSESGFLVDDFGNRLPIGRAWGFWQPLPVVLGCAVVDDFGNWLPVVQPLPVSLDCAVVDDFGNRLPIGQTFELWQGLPAFPGYAVVDDFGNWLPVGRGSSAQRSARKAAPWRPLLAFCNTSEAACIARELVRRGLSGRQAAAIVLVLVGTSRTNLQRQEGSAVQPLNDQHDSTLAVAAVANLRRRVRDRWALLNRKQKEAMRPLVGSLLGT